MFQPFQMVLGTVWTATEKFRTDAISIWMALEKFQTDDTSRSNGERKILNRWCQPCKRLTKNFEWMTPAIQTANKTFWRDDASHSNGWWKISNGWCQPFERLKKYLKHIIPGVRMAKEKGLYWTNGAGDLGVLMKDVFLLPFHRSIAVILITHFFISAFKTWQNLEMDTKSF